MTKPDQRLSRRDNIEQERNRVTLTESCKMEKDVNYSGVTDVSKHQFQGSHWYQNKIQASFPRHIKYESWHITDLINIKNIEIKMIYYHNNLNINFSQSTSSSQYVVTSVYLFLDHKFFIFHKDGCLL